MCVGMLSRFDFLLGAGRPFSFLVGAVFFPIDGQSESIYFCNHRKCLGHIRKLYFSLNK